MEQARDFYRGHSPLTAPGPWSSSLFQVEREIEAIAASSRNACFHEVYAVETGIAASNIPPAESDAAQRFVARMLERIYARDSRSLCYPREKHLCFHGTCRDYAILACSIARSLGIPARLRCGFAFYFNPLRGFGDDHWVVEIWSESEGRWKLVDPEVDKTLPQHEPVKIDPLDVPRSEFQVAGTAWRRMREGRSDAMKYGVDSIGINGEWFMAANVIRDLASLNRREMLPFDYWGLAAEIASQQSVTESQRRCIDEVAAVISDESFDFFKLRAIYQQSPSLQVQDPITSWPKGERTTFVLGLGEDIAGR